jgi:hypothetical protein
MKLFDWFGLKIEVEKVETKVPVLTVPELDFEVVGNGNVGALVTPIHESDSKYGVVGMVTSEDDVMVRVLFFEDGSHTTWHFENLELLEDMKDWIPLMSESNQEGLKELL